MLVSLLLRLMLLVLAEKDDRVETVKVSRLQVV